MSKMTVTDKAVALRNFLGEQHIFIIKEYRTKNHCSLKQAIEKLYRKIKVCA